MQKTQDMQNLQTMQTVQGMKNIRQPRKTQKLWDIWRWLLNFATVGFLTLLLTFFLLPKLGFPFETVLTESMEPSIGTNDLLLINSYQRRPKAGDVIVFQYGGMRFIHRVIEQTETGLRTKGDANSAADPFLVTPEQTEGVCIAVFRNGKQLAAFLRSPLFAALTLGLCLLQGTGRKYRIREQNKFLYHRRRSI